MPIRTLTEHGEQRDRKYKVNIFDPVIWSRVTIK